MIWWLYYNSAQIIILLAGFHMLPHYTVAYKPFFELIVLGIIPGTSVQLGFYSSLIVTLSLLLVILVLTHRAHIAMLPKHT